MFQADDELLARYLKGRATKREFLGVFAGAGAFGILPAQVLRAAASPSGSSRLTHINLRVSNLQRSIAFYEKLFGPGGPASGRNSLGSATQYQLSDSIFLSLQNDADVRKEGRLQFSPIWHQSLYTKPGVWEHIGISVENYDQTIAALKSTGVEMSDKGVLGNPAGGTMWTQDPDGALLQIQNAKAGGGSPVKAQPRPGNPRLNHINLRVSNLQRSIAFYEKLFGPGGPASGRNSLGSATQYQLSDGIVLSLQNDADVRKEGRLQFSPIWHQSLYTKPGVWEHIGISVENYGQVIAALKSTGVEMSDSGVLGNPAGGVMWTQDPDGALLQIQDAKPPGKGR